MVHATRDRLIEEDIKRRMRRFSKRLLGDGKDLQTIVIFESRPDESDLSTEAANGILDFLFRRRESR